MSTHVRSSIYPCPNSTDQTRPAGVVTFVAMGESGGEED